MVMLRYARQNGKPFASALQYATEGLGVPFDELKATADKYRPMLEGLGILDDVPAYQEVMLFVWLWKHDRETEDAARGIADVRVEWDD